MTSTILDEQAFSYGVLFALVVVLFLLVRALTEDVDAANQRAKRRSLVTSAVAVMLLVGGNWLVYVYLSRTLASFLVLPLVLASGTWLLFGTPWLYQVFGGLPKPLRTDSHATRVENALREEQGKFWEELRSLPHFRETLEGDLISLVTGDRVYWTKCHSAVCLAIEFKPGQAVAVVRYETLSRYIQVQSGIAQWLLAGSPSMREAGCASDV